MWVRFPSPAPVILIPCNEAMSGPEPIQDRLVTFERKISPRLADIMKEQRETNRPWFDSQIDKALLGFVFGAFESGRPRMYRRQFKLREMEGKVTIELKRLDCPGDCANGVGIAKLAHSKAVEAELSRNPRIWDTGPQVALRHLIQTEIDACPKNVGPPIAIIKLDVHGPSWLCDGTCNGSSQPNSVPPAVPNPSAACDEAD